MTDTPTNLRVRVNPEHLPTPHLSARARSRMLKEWNQRLAIHDHIAKVIETNNGRRMIYTADHTFSYCDPPASACKPI